MVKKQKFRTNHRSGKTSDIFGELGSTEEYIAALEADLKVITEERDNWEHEFDVCMKRGKNLEAELSRVRQVAEDAIATLKNSLYGKHTCPDMTCSLCEIVEELEARLK